MYPVYGLNFSSNNRYSQDYYIACKHLADARFALKNSKTNSVEQLINLQKKFDYWDKKVPELKVKAEHEENKLNFQGENNTLGKNIDFMA